MENCPAKFVNLTTLFQNVTFEHNFWKLIHNWRKITVPHEDTSVNVLLPQTNLTSSDTCVRVKW